ncbi:MAG: molybdate ABC transporter substrate-binding protein [Planctomycetes bacterium]|nr:molybdate ABC transporter substrate-binding protein [Planctomycetota bacterium]
MGRPAYLAGLIGLLLLGACSGGSEEPEVRVFAAASTAGALDEAARRFEEATGVRVTCSYAGSGTLARQIEQGASADVFLSAHRMWVDHLEARGLLRSRRPFLRNRIVIVRRADEQPVPGTSALEGRIALGDPQYVPAGTYAQQALRTTGTWDVLRGRLVTTPNVRAALRLVEIGETDSGIVYATDAHANDAVRVAHLIPETDHDPIEYPVAVCAGAGDDAAAFVAFLRTPEVLTVFEEHGFTAARER